MKHIDCYLDFISPYAYLAFERLPRALEGLSYQVSYRPILFAGLLQHHGQLGPAEIAPKRDWTYRQVLWLAREHGIAMDLPAAHPFNPLALLRLAWACARQGAPNRYVCEAIFRHAWQGAAAADDAARLQALTAQLAPTRDQAGLVRTPQRARRVHAGRHRRVRGQAHFQLGEAGMQQGAQLVVAGLERLRHPLRERCIETRPLPQRAHHDGFHQRAVARIVQRGQGRGQRRLQRATTMQDHVEDAGGTDARVDAGTHALVFRRAFT